MRVKRARVRVEHGNVASGVNVAAVPVSFMFL